MLTLLLASLALAGEAELFAALAELPPDARRVEALLTELGTCDVRDAAEHTPAQVLLGHRDAVASQVRVSVAPLLHAQWEVVQVLSAHDCELEGLEAWTEPPASPRARLVHHTELTLIRRDAPTYPEAMKALGRDAVLCKVVVIIDARGKPIHMELARCPEGSRESASEAVSQWRWRPYELEGERIPVQTMIDIQYLLR